MRLQKIGLPLLLAAIVCLTSCAVAEKDTPDVLYGWQLQRQGLGYYDWGYTYSLPEEAATDRVEELTYFTMDHYWGGRGPMGVQRQ